MTRQQSITAKCKDCIYDPKEPGTHIRQIYQCPSTTCELYAYRLNSSQLKRQLPQSNDGLALISEDTTLEA